MSSQRKLWVLGPVLMGLTLLLALSRGTTPAPAPAPATENRATVASTEPRAVPDAEPLDDGAEPRHPDIGFRPRERLAEHYRKHGRDFHAKSAADYLRLAQTLRDRPKGPDVLEFVRNDAVTCKFDRASGAFVAYNSDGTLRTFFRPNDGETYFERQKSRAHEAP